VIAEIGFETILGAEYEIANRRMKTASPDDQVEALRRSLAECHCYAVTVFIQPRNAIPEDGPHPAVKLVVEKPAQVAA
jgi:hypothetical protein